MGPRTKVRAVVLCQFAPLPTQIQKHTPLSMAAKQFEVVCPAGVQEGDMITVHDPDGGSFEVAVPAGIGEGQPFLVELTVDAFVSEMQQLADMDPDSVELLRAVLQALLDEEDLDEFVDDHAPKFADYHPDSEQSLEWGGLHLSYVAIVERRLESVFAERGSSADALYTLLEQHSASARGQKFLSKFLSLGDYHAFCAMMQSWTQLETVKAQCEYIDREQAAIDEL